MQIQARAPIELIQNSESLGGMLKRARELRRITLQELAQATHIRLHYLEAIEANQLDKLPALVFLKGYVKTYVNYIGLNQEEVMIFLDHFIEAKQLPEFSAPRNKTPRWIWFLFVFILGLGCFFLLRWIYG